MKLSKKYFMNHHKNKSNFNVYKDFIQNAKQFERTKVENNISGKDLNNFITLLL